MNAVPEEDTVGFAYIAYTQNARAFQELLRGQNWYGSVKLRELRVLKRKNQGEYSDTGPAAIHADENNTP